VGTIRGAQIALGAAGSVHVVWNGPGGKDKPAPLFYARKLDGNFLPQQSVLEDSRFLDGGASVTVGSKGEVYVVWHGALPDAAPGETNRVVMVRKSTDQGAHFSKPTVANVDYTGVCACCSLKTYALPNGDLLILYRAARAADLRDVTLLRSADGGIRFSHQILASWPIAACPMSSMTMHSSTQGVRGVWETEGKVESALLKDGSVEGTPVTLGKGRNPALCTNTSGETLVCWSVGTGWQKGGNLRWRVLDPSGKPTEATGQAPNMPVWGMSAVFSQGGDFVVVY
jgi:hypothetical protein